MKNVSMKPFIYSVAALCVIGTVFAATDAHAGSCPADKMLTTPQDIPIKQSVGMKRETLAIVNLTGWRNLGDLRLRTRRLTIAAHGIVPTHQHDDRPSIVYVLSGEIVEHSSLCAVPILHKAGEWTPEFGPGHAHWWENETDKPVVLTSSDVVPPEGLDKPEDM